MLRPIKVKPLDNCQLWVRYSDGIECTVDLSDLVGKGVFSLWNDYREFQKVHIGTNGEIAWNDQVEICPDSIYLKITGKNPEDIFPKLKELAVYA